MHQSITALVNCQGVLTQIIDEWTSGQNVMFTKYVGQMQCCPNVKFTKCQLMKKVKLTNQQVNKMAALPLP
jgi:hypothetical protein